MAQNPYDKVAKTQKFIDNATGESNKSSKGRKNLKGERKKSKIVAVYLTPNDYEILKEKAEKARLTISQFLIFKAFYE